MWRFTAILTLLGLYLFAAANGASAHAVLLRVLPAAGQTLQSAPAEVRLLFSEPIDARFSGVSVLDSTGTAIDRGDSRVDESDDRQLVVSLPPNLAKGVYVVNWRSLSTIDIHPDTGQYRLFVGVPATGDGAALATGGALQNGSTPLTAVARWWLYLSASIFAGSLAAWKLAFAPALAVDSERATAARRPVFRLAVLGGVLLVVGTLVAAVAQAAAAANVSLDGDLASPLVNLLTGGRYATIWWPRLSLCIIAVVLVATTGLDGLGSDCAVAIVPAILLTSSLTSHSAALPSATAVGILVDWLHVIGAAVWVGGLASLAVLGSGVLRRADSRLLVRVVQRFTRLALVAFALTALSGVLQAFLEVGRWDLLFTTTYGLGVLAKVLLLAAMAALASLNRRNASAGAAGIERVFFARGVRAELLMGAAALAVAAVLTGTAPARQTAPTSTPAFLAGATTATP